MRRLLVLVSLLALALLAGCGSTDKTTPVACLEDSGAYLRALRQAPGEVALANGTPISGCLVERQDVGEQATVGTALVTAATKLNAEAREDPGGDANLQLGYLLGAVTHGAEGADGIDTELVRRLTAAARYSPDGRPLPPAFLHTYREGFDAGEAHG